MIGKQIQETALEKLKARSINRLLKFGRADFVLDAAAKNAHQEIGPFNMVEKPPTLVMIQDLLLYTIM
jgi:hypothetical protein